MDTTVTSTTGEEGTSSGVYVYSIIECADPRTFGKIGIGGRGDDVYTIHYRDLAAVVSQAALQVYDPTRENALTHERVNQVVMVDNGFTPVPMSFGTLFKTEEDTIEFLKDTYDALRDVLQKMKDKLEFGLKVNWDRDSVLAEVEQENEELRRLKAEIESNQQTSTYFARMHLGRLVEQALADKSDSYVREIYDELRETAIAARRNKVVEYAEQQLTDDEPVRQELLGLHLQLEEGQIGEQEFTEREAGLFARLREIREYRKELAQEGIETSAPTETEGRTFVIEIPEELE